MKYLGNACERKEERPEPIATANIDVLDEDASSEANRVVSKRASRCIDDSGPRSEHSVESRASEQSMHSTGSQVSDGSIEAGEFVFHAIDDLIEEHLKEVFPKPRLINRNTITLTKKSYKAVVRDLRNKIHKRYSSLNASIDRYMSDNPLSINHLPCRY
jgi:hypothetical protein